MSTDNKSLPHLLPTPSILVDPCFALDEFGLWATARLRGADTRELDLYLPARRTVRRIEVGHGEDAMDQLGRGSRQRLLAALDKALARPLRLVVDPRRSDGEGTILDEFGKPREAATHALASVMGANSFTTAAHAIELSIKEPRADRLALGAASLFGPPAAALFRHQGRGAPSGGLISSVPMTRIVPSPARRPNLKVARYVRTASANARGHNSLEAQHGRINRHLEALGLRSPHVVVDEACSGLGTGRTGIDAILRLADQGQIDVVVATSADRFFRSAAQFDRFLLQLRMRNVTVMLVDHASTLGLWEPQPRRKARRGA